MIAWSGFVPYPKGFYYMHRGNGYGPFDTVDKMVTACSQRRWKDGWWMYHCAGNGVPIYAYKGQEVEG